MSSGSRWSEAFVHQLSDKEFRDEFVADRVRSRIAMLIRKLREQEDRTWSQSELGQRMGKPQSVVSRLEDPDYGRESLQTLLDVAAAFDLPLLVDIPEWEDWHRQMSARPSGDFSRKSFDVEHLAGRAKAFEVALESGKVVQFGEAPTTASSRDEMKDFSKPEITAAAS